MEEQIIHEGTINQKKRSGLMHSLKLAGTYSLTGLHSCIVVPTLAITSCALYLSAAAIAVAVPIYVIASIFNISLPFTLMNFGFWTPPTFIAASLSIIVAMLCYVGGKALWKLLNRYITWVTNNIERCRSFK